MPDSVPVPEEAVTLTDEEFRLASLAAVSVGMYPQSNYWQRVAIAAAKAVVPSTQSAAIARGIAAERKRVIKLAIERGAVCQDENGDTEDFADVIGGDHA